MSWILQDMIPPYNILLQDCENKKIGLNCVFKFPQFFAYLIWVYVIKRYMDKYDIIKQIILQPQF